MKKIINHIEEDVLSIILVCMVLLVFIEVVARKLGIGIDWAQELTLILNAWFVLIGASFCVRKNAHICVSFLVDKLSYKLALTASIFAIIACIFYSTIFFYGSWVYILKIKQFGLELQDIPIKRWIAASCLLVGFTLLIIRFLQILYLSIFYKKSGLLRQIGEAEESMELAKQINQEGAK